MKTTFEQPWKMSCRMAALACGTASWLQAQSSVSVAQADARTLAAWNVIALKTTSRAAFSPPRETRAMAMVAMAVFDAVNGITQMYDPHAVVVNVAGTASTAAAVSAAAHGVLISLYPAERATLDATRDSALAHIPAGQPKEDGVDAGRRVAESVVAMRSHDGAAARAPYALGSGRGVWVPTPPAFGAALEPGWGTVTPFVMKSRAQFRPPPPPELESETYRRDYLEVMQVGGANSAARTPAQSAVARFWITTAAQLWNQLVRQLTVEHSLDVTAAARAYLLLNLAGADAMIAAWDAKYTYNQWRPVTAARHRASGHDAISSDTSWTPAITTPPFPDYPAGHTSYGGAAEEVLSALFGERPGELSMTSPTAPGQTHRFRTFREIAELTVNARVWGGVHWRTSSVAGRTLGQRIGALAVENAPRRR
jgi:hypothetical protein